MINLWIQGDPPTATHFIQDGDISLGIISILVIPGPVDNLTYWFHVDVKEEQTKSTEPYA